MRETVSLQQFLKEYAQKTGNKPQVIDYSGLKQCMKNVIRANTHKKLTYCEVRY